MREIKFRFVFKHRKTREIKFHFCTLDELLEGPLDENSEHLAMDALADAGYDLIAKDQYADLKDKHSKEIYEGDVIKDQFGNAYKINFNCGSFLIELGPDCVSILFNLIPESYCEIIGNAYENPELLDEENRSGGRAKSVKCENEGFENDV